MLKLTLRNWRCYADLTFEFAGPTFIVGQNGRGKSAVRDALEFVYLGTGRLMGAPTKRELAAAAIRTWPVDHEHTLDTCEVIAECAGIRTRRTMDRDGAQLVYQCAWLEAEDRWSEEEPMPLQRDRGNPFGDTPDDLVRVMLDPWHFFSLDAQRRQEILVTATSEAHVGEDVALAALMKRLQYTTADDLQAIQDAAKWVASEGFRGAEAAAVDQRQVAKRDAAAVTVGEPPSPNAVPTGDGLVVNLDVEVPLQAHEHRLAVLRVQHVEAVRLESAGTGALAGKLAEAESALDELERTETDWSSLDLTRQTEEALAALEKLDSGDGPLEPVPLDPDLGTAEALALEAAHKARDSASETVGEAVAAIVNLEKTQASQGSLPRPAVCPKGPPGMRCPVKPSVWAPAVAKVQADPAVTEAKLDGLRGELVEAKDRLQEAQEGLDKATAANGATYRAQHAHGRLLEAYRDHQAKLEKAVELVAQRTEIKVKAKAAAESARKAELARASERVTSAKARLLAAGESQAPEVSSEDLLEKIQRGEGVVQAARDYWREDEAHLQRVLAKDRAADTVERWDAIAQLLKPDGIETELGGTAREDFMALLDEAAGLSGQIYLDADYGLTVDTPDSDQPRYPLQLSTSQRMAVGVALQHALCQLLGFPILVTDALDTFDKRGRAAWAELATKVADRYPGAVVGLATITKEPPGFSPPPWQTYWLKGQGVVEILGTF